MPRQQISCAAEPGKKRRQCNEIERRKITATAGVCSCWRVRSDAVPVKSVTLESGHVNVYVRKLKSASEKHYDTQKKANDKTDKIKISPGHSRPPFLPLRPLALACGCKAASKRSARPGVSRIAPRSKMHLRVSFSRAALIRTSLNSGSFAKRSEPCSSHTSSLPSTVRRSEVNSV